MNSIRAYKGRPALAAKEASGLLGFPKSGERRLYFILTTVLLCTIFSLSFGGVLVRADSVGQKEKAEYKFYTSILIYPGDTLYTIAEEHMGKQYTSADQYVREVMRMNSLREEKIHAGGYLIIPYYSEMEYPDIAGENWQND